MKALRLLYILDGHRPVPCPDVLAWADWFESHDQERQVAVTEVAGLVVSTVFIGVNISHQESKLIVFETAIFNSASEVEIAERHTSWEEAEHRHHEIVESLRRP